MVDYTKLNVEESEEFETRRGRGADNPAYPLFEQALADGKPRKISGLSIKDNSDGDMSEFLRVARDCASAAQKLKRLNEGNGKIEASVKKEVVNGEGIVRIKAKWLERYSTGENGVVTDAVITPDAAAEPAGAARRRRGAGE